MNWRWIKLECFGLLMMAVAGGVSAQPQAPDTLWTRVTPFPELNFLNIGEMVQLPSGSVLVSVAPDDTIGGGTCTGMGIVKLDTSGNVVWRRSCGEVYCMTATFICQTAPNRFALAGWLGFPVGDVYVVIVDSEATTLYQHRYQSSSDEHIAGICSSSDGGFLVVYKRAASVETAEWIKFSSTGDSLWAGHEEIPGNRIWPHAVASTLDGGYVITGYTGVLGEPLSSFLLRLDAAGNMQFSRTYSLMTETAGWDVAALGNGDFVMCGYTDSLNVADPTHAYVMRVNSMGDPLWTWISPPEDGPDQAIRVIATGDGGFLASYTQGCDLVRFNASNQLLWRHTYAQLPGPWLLSSEPCMLQDEMGRYLLVGRAAIDTSIVQAIGVVKTLPDLVATTDPSPQAIPQEIRLTAYPNPFNSRTEIVFDLPRAMNVKLRVFNLLGETVATLAEGNMQGGEHRVSFDAEGIASGVYLYRVEAGGTSLCRKMLLLR